MITMFSVYKQVKHIMPGCRKKNVSYYYLYLALLLTLPQWKAYLFRSKTNIASILKLAGFSIKLQLSQSRLNRNLLLQRVIAYNQYVVSRRYQPLQNVLSALAQLIIGLLLTCLRAYPLTFLVLTYFLRTGPYYYLFLLVVLKQLYTVG